MAGRSRKRERLRKCTHDKQLQEIKIGWNLKLCVPIYVYKSLIWRPGVQSLAMMCADHQGTAQNEGKPQPAARRL